MTVRVTWTHHATVRARERGLVNLRTREAIAEGRYETWWEVDPRHDRGLRCNLVVREVFNAIEHYIVVRRDDRVGAEVDSYAVVSVLTKSQYLFNREYLWASTDEDAVRLHATKQRPPPLTAPVAELLRRKP